MWWWSDLGAVPLTADETRKTCRIQRTTQLVSRGNFVPPWSLVEQRCACNEFKARIKTIHTQAVLVCVPSMAEVVPETDQCRPESSRRLC